MVKGLTRVFRPLALDRETRDYLAGFYRPRAGGLLICGAVAAAQALLVLPVLALVRMAFDRAIPKGNLRLLLLIGVGILLLRLASIGISLALRAAHLKLLKRAIMEMREDLLGRLFTFSRSLYTQLDRSTAHARIVQDTERLDNVSYQLASRFLPALFTAVPLIGVLAFLNWRLFALLAVLFPLVLLAARLTSGTVQRRLFIFHRSFERFATGIHFVLQQMDLIRTQANEEGEIERQRRHIEDLNATSERMAFGFALHGQAQAAVTSIGGVVLLVAGGAAVARHAMSLGELLAFWVAASLLYGHVNAVMSSIPQILAALESATTLVQLARAGPLRPYAGRRAIQWNGRLLFDEVSFGYGRGPVLREVNLEIPPGNTLGLVGPNGAGKSTVLLLLLGFYRPDNGRILADEVPYDELDVTVLRRSIGVVPQNPSFFSGTVFENLVYGRATASREEVEEAVRQAQAEEFIARLPRGFDTEIGESGVLLSGGQAQRLAVARALLGRPRLLVLDEPTNHLDRNAVASLLTSLEALEHRPGILLISHDPEVLRITSGVYWLRDGRLTAGAGQREEGILAHGR